MIYTSHRKEKTRFIPVFRLTFVLRISVCFHKTTKKNKTKLEKDNNKKETNEKKTYDYLFQLKIK
jgi:hypothetical protein